MNNERTRVAKYIVEFIVMLGIVGFTYNFVRHYIKEKTELREQRLWRDKMEELYCSLNYWLEIKQRGNSLIPYFEERNIKSIAIYGMKELGQRLYDELLNSPIEVKYAIDQNADKMYAGIPIFKPDQDMENVDAIVVTAPFYFKKIKKTMSEKSDAMILDITDVLFSVS